MIRKILLILATPLVICLGLIGIFMVSLLWPIVLIGKLCCGHKNDFINLLEETIFSVYGFCCFISILPIYSLKRGTRIKDVF